MLLRHRRGFLSKHKGEGEKAYIPYRALVQTCSVADELPSVSLLDRSNFFSTTKSQRRRKRVLTKEANFFIVFAEKQKTSAFSSYSVERN